MHPPISVWQYAPVPAALGTIATAGREAEHQRTISAREPDL